MQCQLGFRVESLRVHVPTLDVSLRNCHIFFISGLGLYGLDGATLQKLVTLKTFIGLVFSVGVLLAAGNFQLQSSIFC